MNPYAGQTASGFVNVGGSLTGAQNAAPKVETVSELVNTIINVAGSVLQSSASIADAVTGAKPQNPTDKGQGTPLSLAEQLRMIRYILNEAEGELSRARNGLGV